MVEVDSLHFGDCFDVLEMMQDKSADMVLCDLPYGVTACDWDVEIDLDRLWKEYKRLLKPGGAVVLTATQPFETKLINSNPKWFRYKWVWKKTRAVGFLNANKMPLRIHEDVLVFSPGKTIYNPQFELGQPYVSKRKSPGKSGIYREVKRSDTVNTGYRFPKDLVEFSNTCEKVVHNTQKPVALFEYLIRTYSHAGALVLDNTAGSGTTAIAAVNTGRRYICVEKNMANYMVMIDRVQQHRDERQCM